MEYTKNWLIFQILAGVLCFELMTLVERGIGGGAAAVLGVLALTAPDHLAANIVAVFALLYGAQLAGLVVFSAASWVPRSLAGLFSILGTHSILLTAWYYLDGKLDAASGLVALALTLALFACLPTDTRSTVNDEKPAWGWSAITVVANAFLFTVVAYASFSARTTISIRTPWPLLPDYILPVLAFLFLSGLLAARKAKAAWIVALASLATIVSLNLIAPLVYANGYGFDGFLHRASERVILETGTLEPKTPYYIGQYTLVTWLARLADVSPGDIDRLLVPFASSLLAFAAWSVFRGYKGGRWSIALVPLVLVPGSFIATTPQSFASLLGLTALGFALANDEKGPRWTLAAIAGLWSLAAHPLAGLPFACAAALALWSNHLRASEKAGHRSPLVYLLVAAGTISVPGAFLLNGLKIGAMSRIWEAAGAIVLPPANHVALWADWAAWCIWLLPWMLLAGSVLAIAWDEKRRTLWGPLSALGLGVFISGLFLKTAGDFSFLIDYERSNYADRLIQVAWLILAFPAAYGFGLLASRLMKRPVLNQLAVITALCLLYAGSAYASLPRHDAAAASRGWSVGTADMEAVRWIEGDARGARYAVLANQTVSAAAVDAYGFRRYVRTPEGEDVFYYPLPTGGTLYQLYLQAVAPTPSFDAIREAVSLTRSEIVYVVVNQYWWDADKVSAALEARAQAVQTFGNGAVRVYRFDANN